MGKKNNFRDTKNIKKDLDYPKVQEKNYDPCDKFVHEIRNQKTIINFLIKIIKGLTADTEILKLIKDIENEK